MLIRATLLPSADASIEDRERSFFVSRSTTALLSPSPAPSPSPTESLDVVSRRLVSDLHAPRPAIFWFDLLASASIGWAAFAVALVATPWTPLMLAAAAVSG